ncbi:MAG: GNAT family N-acetyltransferase [Anaerolineaceae bacterium]
MTKLQIRHARQDDLEKMISIDHHSDGAYAYKLEVIKDKHSQTNTIQRVKLPRTVSVTYPKDQETLLNSWAKSESILVGCLMDELVAYVSMEGSSLPKTARICDLAVEKNLRQKGIATSMLGACEAWARERKLGRLLIELQMRNDPAISLVKKSGFELCGYLDRFFPNGDTALFFEKRLV